MKSMVKGLLACVLGCVGVGAVEAATVRYEFDVVGSTATSFRNLSIFDPADPSSNSLGFAPVTDPVLANEIGTEWNPLKNIPAGPVVVDADFFDGGQVITDLSQIDAGNEVSFRCISGSACSVYDGLFFLSSFNPFELEAPGFFSDRYDFDRGSLTYAEGEFLDFDEFGPSGSTTYQGTRYFWSDAFAVVDATNFTARLLPAPLPASSLLLGVALIPLAAIRRRKNRA